MVEREHIQQLFEALSTHGYQLIGPTVRDCAIIYDVITSVDDLPIGYTDEQREGYYRLKKRDDEALFGYNVGPHSWKRFLYPPVLRLWRARREREGSSFEIIPEATEVPKRAFIGVHSCDLHAIFIQDRVFLGDKYVDPAYQERRDNVCIIAVHCGPAGGTCFCTSMHTGPRASHGFDLALTEVLTPPHHYFVAETGTGLGTELLPRQPFYLPVFD